MPSLTFHSLLLAIAIACFFIDVIMVVTRVRLVSLGLFFFAAGMLLPG